MVMYIGGKMSEMMTRKQLYLPKRLNQFLKRTAKQRGISEAEVIRQALEREVQISAPVVRDSKKALDEIIAFARSLRERPELMQGEPVRWNRQELYEERESRWFKKDEGG
jgi:thiamine pyrophosphate-dependent acetolactate synthase large subunit-like protein